MSNPELPKYDPSGLPQNENPQDDGSAMLGIKVDDLLYQLDSDKIPDNPLPEPPSSQN